MNIQFSPQDIVDARAMALKRYNAAGTNNNIDLSGLADDKAKRIRIDYIGALGEIALAKALGEPHQLAQGTYKGADHTDRWGTDWHIRATERGDGRLIVRRRDPLTGIYALVVVDLKSRSAKVAGYCRHQCVAQDALVSDGGNGREPAYWIPQRRLMGVETYLHRRGIWGDDELEA